MMGVMTPSINNIKTEIIYIVIVIIVVIMIVTAVVIIVTVFTVINKFISISISLLFFK